MMARRADRTEMDIELLLHWAYRDELSKRQTSAAEGIWDRIDEIAQRGGVDDRGHGSAQRYAHFGLPDPDAELIGQAVARLADEVIDWPANFDAIAGELSGLISINDMTRQDAPRRQPKAEWGEAGSKALRAWWGDSGARPVRDRPRDVLMVGSLRTGALVTMHAIQGTRPDWNDEPPQPSMVPALKGQHAMVVGECRGRNLYTSGAYCPLKWEPSPLSIITTRAEYVAWHRGLCQLAETIQLSKFVALPPKASKAPWVDVSSPSDREPIEIRPEVKLQARPLSPHRDRMGLPARRQRPSPVRYPLEAAGS